MYDEEQRMLEAIDRMQDSLKECRVAVDKAQIQVAEVMCLLDELVRKVKLMGSEQAICDFVGEELEKP